MTDTVQSIMMRVPVTMNIGPVPADVASHSQKFTFALAHITRILGEKGITADVGGEHALARYEVDGTIKTHNVKGDVVDSRHFQIHPATSGGHALRVSTDDGVTFDEIAVFKNSSVAEAFGSAWVDGRAELTA